MTAAAPPFGVRKLDVSFADLRRGGEARLRIYLPDAAGIVPCAVVSHGFGSSRLGYAFLGRHLASQGIAAVHVAHGANEARILARGAEGRAEFLLALEDRERIRARTGDVIAAIDALEGGLLGKLPCEIDAARLAFVGHSSGAQTGLMLAGARLQPDEVQLADPRPRAFVLLSPPGLGGRGLFPGSLAAIQRPCLLSFGSRDEGPRGQPAAWRAEAFDDLPAGGKAELIVEGAVHETFADAPLEGVPADRGQVEVIQKATAAFLRAYLKHDRGALGELRGLPGTSLRTK